MTVVVKKKNVCVLVTIVTVSVLLYLRQLSGSVAEDSTSYSLPPCFTGDSPRILIVVTSKVEDDRVRNIFREGPFKHDWVSCSGKKIEVEWRFSLEYPSPLYEGYLPPQLTLESETHRDLKHNVHNRYSSSPTRLTVLEGILARFDWDYLVKIADDTLIDPVRLLNYLGGSRAVFYGGLVGLHQDRVPYTVENLSIYSRTALMNIVSALPFVKREAGNIPVTVGRIADVLKLRPSQIGLGFNGSAHFGAVCKRALFITDVSEVQLAGGYHSLLSRDSFC